MLVGRAVNMPVGHFRYPPAQSPFRSINPDSSRPCSPQIKLRRTYFTPRSTLPLVKAVDYT
jgi:hypothetical protein